MAETPRSAIGPLTTAVVTALKADTALTAALGGAHVYSAPPQDQARPYLLVWGGREVPWNQLRSTGRHVQVLVRAWSDYQGSREVDTLIDLVVAGLDNVALTLDGWAQAMPLQFVESREPQRLLIDGVPSMERVAVFETRVR